MSLEAAVPAEQRAPALADVTPYRVRSSEERVRLVPAPGQVSPFLRWAGSKRWLIPTLLGIIPRKFGRYYEPFLGSGAAFLALETDRGALLSDTIPGLVNCFEQVRDAPELVAKVASEWSTDSDTYYELRSTVYPGDPIRAAAQFIYLNKLCFNGLYRENRDGRFNVPYGRPKTPNIVNADHLVAASERLKRSVTLAVTDFDAALSECERGDLVYRDPPYVAGHRNNGFVDYNARLFQWSDQERLADTFSRLDAKGVLVVQSNADHESIRRLYQKFNFLPISRFSSMSSRATNRGRSSELLIIGRSLAGTVR